MADINTTVSEIRDYGDIDAILPDDFDPSSDTYDMNAEPSTPDTTPGQPAPTIAQAPETNASGTSDPAASTDPTTVQPEPAQQPAAAPSAPQTIKVKFNHEERELSVDEAAIYAQKGMNYDKLQERAASFEAQATKTENLAKQLGYASAEEMLVAAETNFIERQVQELVEAGNTEAMARFLVTQQMAKQRQESVGTGSQPPAQDAGSASSRVQSTPTAQDIARNEEIMEFVKAYPGLTKLPEEVVAAHKSGTRLIVAYERYKNQAALNELAIMKQNQAAAAKAPVTGVVGKTTPPGSNPADDPFVKGFDADSSW